MWELDAPIVHWCTTASSPTLSGKVAGFRYGLPSRHQLIKAGREPIFGPTCGEITLIIAGPTPDLANQAWPVHRNNFQPMSVLMVFVTLQAMQEIPSLILAKQFLLWFAGSWTNSGGLPLDRRSKLVKANHIRLWLSFVSTHSEPRAIVKTVIALTPCSIRTIT